jgi:uncharacterized membrane protein
MSKKYAPLAIFVGLFLLGIIGCIAYVVTADARCPLEINDHLRWRTKFFCEAKLADVALVLFSYGLVLVTAYLVWATIRLWTAGEDQLIHAQNTARRQLRAYISAEPDGIVDFNPNDQVVARVRFQNTGSVFAKNVRTFVNRKLSDNGDLPESAFPIDEAEIFGDNVIAPSANILYATQAIRKSEIAVNRDAAESRGRSYYLYVWGVVQYSDGFVAGRYTKFCHRYNFSSAPADVYTILRENYRYHHRGNKIDDMD